METALTFESNRQKFHYAVTLFALLLLAIGLCTSKFLSSVGGITLGVNWLLEGDWKRKWQIIKNDRHLWLLLILYFVFVVGQFQSSPIGDGVKLLRTKLPLLYMPLVIATTRIKHKHIQLITEFFPYMVALTTLLAWYNLLFTDLEIRNIYPFCKHISYGIQMCVGSIICFSFLGRKVFDSKKHNTILLLVGIYLIICMIAFEKYTALLAGTITFVVWAIYYVYTLCSKLIKIVFPIVLLIFTTIFILGLRHAILNYFTPRFDFEAVHQQQTARGNNYTFDTNSLVENGQYIGVYVCEPELREAWAVRSQIPFDDVFPTLVRYLNSKDEHKDYEAVMALADSEIEDVENGVANIKYKLPLARMYVTFFEVSDTHSIADKSMLQRFYFWKIACKMISERPLIGYGCGTATKFFQAEQLKNESINEPLRDPHQQYLEDAMTFGIPIALLIICIYIYLIINGIRCKNPLLTINLFMLMLTLFVEGNNYQAATILFAVVTTIFSYYNLTEKEQVSD